MSVAPSIIPRGCSTTCSSLFRLQLIRLKLRMLFVQRSLNIRIDIAHDKARRSALPAELVVGTPLLHLSYGVIDPRRALIYDGENVSREFLVLNHCASP